MVKEPNIVFVPEKEWADYLRKGEQKKDVLGKYLSMKNDIILLRKDLKSKSEIEKVFLHEYGHFIWERLSPDEKKRFEQTIPPSLRGLRAPLASIDQEFFAEHFRNYISGLKVSPNEVLFFNEILDRMDRNRKEIKSWIPQLIWEYKNLKTGTRSLEVRKLKELKEVI
jgi:hypothetical protein